MTIERATSGGSVSRKDEWVEKLRSSEVSIGLGGVERI